MVAMACSRRLCAAGISVVWPKACAVALAGGGRMMKSHKGGFGQHMCVYAADALCFLGWDR